MYGGRDMTFKESREEARGRVVKFACEVCAYRAKKLIKLFRN